MTLRSIGDGVITTDLDGKVVLINKITEKLTGWSLQDAIGRPIQEVFKIINEKTGKSCHNPIGKAIVELANFALHGSSVSCRFSIPNDLWLVDVDLGQISQVIQNLVINAKHAMPDGGEIKISCANIANLRAEIPLDLSEKAYIKIVVRDNGCGIANKYLEKIFDPYFTTKQKGSGLGLAITHSIISKHDGYIGVQSVISEGTAFTIYLPAADNQIVKRPTTEVCNPEIVRVRILVVDDNKHVKDIAKQMLGGLGHEVLLAGDGKETLKMFIEQRDLGKPVDVISMDLTIPGGMGGKDTIEEILKIDPEVKVIVSSGYSTDPVMANYQQYGFKAAIAKPFMLTELTQVITDVLS